MSLEKKAVIIQAKELFEDIFLPITERPKYDKNTLPVYFYRYIGVEDEGRYLNEIRYIDNKLSSLNGLYRRFVNEIPLAQNSSLVQKMNEIWGFVKAESFQTEDVFNILSKANLFSFTNKDEINSKVKEVMSEVISLYIDNQDVLNLSKVKTLILKLLIWTNSYIIPFFNMNTDRYNPKILHYGKISEHEFYFLIFASRMGCDVLFINSENDIDYIKSDTKFEYSFVLLRSKRISQPSFPESREINRVNRNEQREAISENLNIFENVMVCKSIKAKNIFEDMLTSVKSRTGYIERPIPVVPIYFYAVHGIGGDLSEDIDIYYNQIFNLDKILSKSNCRYLKFENEIPLKMANEVINQTANIWSRFNELNKENAKALINQLINSGVFPRQKEQIIENTIKNYFIDVATLYLENEKDITLNKFKNFALKMIMWVKDYFKDYQTDTKILYYGNIKEVEIYGLIYFAMLGSDVLYINPSKSCLGAFKTIGQNNQLINEIEYDNDLNPEDFPKEERLVRKTTVAYRASKEIEQVIYGSDVGVFKPWQLEGFNVLPVTLKTTYDELKILWREPAKVRPEFKVQGDTVYIPNLFAKINGTPEDISEYWDDFNKICNVKNYVLMPELPFIKASYTKRDLSTVAYYFDMNGNLIKDEVMNSNLYRFSYLRTTLQDLIFNKMTEVMNSPKFFKKDIDREFKMRVLLTILNLDEKIVEMLEKFDFSGDIPKLVIFDNQRSVFSDEDSIVVSFLNLIGVDIIIFTPTNYNNIENKIHESNFDIHQLPTMAFDLELSKQFYYSKKKTEKSFIQRIFGL